MKKRPQRHFKELRELDELQDLVNKRPTEANKKKFEKKLEMFWSGRK